MQVYIMRHGDAVMHAASDAERPLSQKGRDESTIMAQWLEARQPHVDKVLVSPYLRAQQTLEVLTRSLTLPAEAEVMPQLTPSGNEEYIASYIGALASEGINAILIVSHLPLVGYLVAQLCPAEQPPMFSTSSIASIQFDTERQKGQLEWQIGPNQVHLMSQ
ncbi:phosphohistidine phosphatase SixA [Moellerella wisconsensis]|uniref:Phosphohistidine phosphatase SixA n=2 Tax=Moellerella wisconsensis TaxID=158849 RepID=A0A9Q8Q015_9GAMM|nr:phosphohistidine phosphatase SixA [Moellerella wisconsensis]KLN96851.1 phosphohistidine phosphatase [Moellerella wisconsensis]UNH23220.1 phosphohistidine phosphatase SixA [Moellerella wisconsensis]UNH26296.1 phosphohistidine phosphatase SixA [Moellerella wisconsensis]UNH29711.1 phosphohistidine phosphatase SixA [Moellerella wisconsensis]UNH37907.1 phosphohistidine phosphatase SixA [Moellerella wisconsensis]